MKTARIARAALAALALTTAAGCLLPETPAPVIPLTAAEQASVLACQGVLSKQVDRLWTRTYKELDRCSRAALALQLERERELDGDNAARYDRRREQMVARCDAAFARVGKVTTTAIDSIAGTCGAVEGLILHSLGRGDPLGWRTVNAVLAGVGGDPFESVEQIGAALCSGVVGDALNTLGFTVARTSDLIRKYYAPQSSQAFVDHLMSFLDPRCEVEFA